jgi:hypothetical protein
MPAPCADQAGSHGERLDGDERRHVGAAAVADGQVVAFGVERREEVERQPVELDLGVEAIGEGFGDALAQDRRRERNSDDD